MFMFVLMSMHDGCVKILVGKGGATFKKIYNFRHQMTNPTERGTSCEAVLCHCALITSSCFELNIHKQHISLSESSSSEQPGIFILSEFLDVSYDSFICITLDCSL